MEPDDFLYRLAERQHGFITRWDMRAVGLSRHAAQHRIDRGDFEPHGLRVLRRPGAPLTEAARVMRAVLDAGTGAVAAGPCAAAWWGIPGFNSSPIHVTRHRADTNFPPTFADVVHEVLDLTTNQVTVLDGIPIVRPERLAFELHAMVSPGRAARAVETLWAKRLVCGGSLRSIFAELAGRGRKGTVAMRAFLSEHPVDWVPPASGLEARVMNELSNRSLGEWRRQVDLGGDAWTGRVDFKHAVLPIVIEVQSERYHAALADRAADARRLTQLRHDGFVVVEVWDTDVWYRFDKVASQVRAAIAAVRRAA